MTVPILKPQLLGSNLLVALGQKNIPVTYTPYIQDCPIELSSNLQRSHTEPLIVILLSIWYYIA